MIKMAKEKSLSSSEIKKLIKSKNFIIGTARTIKGLKLGKIDKVLLSSNCPKNAVDGINYYAELSKAETVKLKYHNDDLGVICKKPFSISVLSILKGAR